MKKPGSVRSFAAAVAAVGLLTSSVAAGASTVASAAPAVASPLVTLSVFGTAGSRAALCGANSAAVAGAAATAVAQGQPGCVLPALDSAPPPVVADVPPPPPALAPLAVAGPPNMLPLLAILGLALGAYWLLGESILGDDDTGEFDRSPF